jgi:hypothetical protein
VDHVRRVSRVCPQRLDSLATSHSSGKFVHLPGLFSSSLPPRVYRPSTSTLTVSTCPLTGEWVRAVSTQPVPLSTSALIRGGRRGGA